MKIKTILLMLILFIASSINLWAFSVSYFAPSLYTSDVAALNNQS